MCGIRIGPKEAICQARRIFGLTVPRTRLLDLHNRSLNGTRRVPAGNSMGILAERRPRDRWRGCWWLVWLSVDVREGGDTLQWNDVHELQRMGHCCKPCCSIPASRGPKPRCVPSSIGNEAMSISLSPAMHRNVDTRDAFRSSQTSAHDMMVSSIAWIALRVAPGDCQSDPSHVTGIVFRSHKISAVDRRRQFDIRGSRAVVSAMRSVTSPISTSISPCSSLVWQSRPHTFAFPNLVGFIGRF